MAFADSVPSGPTAAPATPDAPGSALTDGIARVSSVAAVYGSSHPRVLEVAGAVAAVIRERAASGPAQIVVPDDAHAASDVGHLGARLLRDLAHLGVALVEFGADATGPDLVALAALVRKAAAPRSGGGAFVSPEFSSLPPPVRVVLRDFGKPALDADVLPAPGILPHVPSGGAAEETSIDGATRALLRKVVEIALRRGTAPAPEMGTGDAVRPANLREAIRAAAESLFRTLRSDAPPGERTIADILGEAHDGIFSGAPI